MVNMLSLWNLSIVPDFIELFFFLFIVCVFILSCLELKITDLKFTIREFMCRADDFGLHFAAPDFWADLHC